MIKLYYVPMTRAGRVRWLLEELEVPYELVRLDVGAKQNKSAEYLAIHPHGHVPALVDDDGTAMFESVAIVLHLADRFPERGLAPPPGSPARAHYYQWAIYSMSELEPAVAAVAYHTSMRAPERRIPAVADEGRAKFADSARVLVDHLAARAYMLGDTFSAADVLIGGALAWGKAVGLLEPYPKLVEYLRSLTGRAAFRRARAD